MPDFTTFDSPLGPLYAFATPVGLLRLSYEGAREEVPLTSTGEGATSVQFDAVRTQLDEYFAGTRQTFDLPIDWSLIRGFAERVLKATASIPYGQTMTYAEVAAMAGNPRAVRAAGNALGSNPLPIVIPCHRVVRTGGSLGGYTGGVSKKEFLLGLESGSPN